ncbi:von Hippel-Lindau disease tumor suppressor-like [Lingula anatina]|uniref:von Hippel-Lindau disease tumor suppressor n=1 Tax=Lingula anatina TaxID=7574 RepID=A0A1S3JSQ1_LINAN|nr:von Hippel-Lindau disease tumor suppressor-like [Lingula anatina]|eukprot:XP_013413378.1 von Hippel-Lindau disease tumor suppressor-like [Lingula anatina]
MTGPKGAGGASSGNHEDESRPVLLKAQTSRTYAFVRFINKTARHVDVIWLNYEGARVRYKTLSPEQWVDVNTFVGHPWIFRDSVSGDRLVVQHEAVYEPEGWNIEEGWPPTRRLVSITIPVYTLKERCIQLIRRYVKDEDISSLEIPRSLQQDIRNTRSNFVPLIDRQALLNEQQQQIQQHLVQQQQHHQHHHHHQEPQL